jgi:hypothetical protein
VNRWIFAAALFAPLIAQPVADWERREQLKQLPEQVKKVLPVLAQLKPQDWIRQGAPEAYAQHWKSAQDEVGYLDATIQKLMQQPDRLALGLEAYFRFSALESRLRSVVEAIRKYQNPALADLIESMANESLSSRVALQQFVSEVAAQRDAEWKIMEEEAQRCRTLLTAPARATPRPAVAPKKP